MIPASPDKIGRDYSTSVPGSEDSGTQARIEALLFVAPAPVTVAQLASSLKLKPKLVSEALRALEQRYLQGGLRLQVHGDGYQITTAPELADDVEQFLKLESVTRLSHAAVEVLAIVSYKQPITRPQIDAIRGVNSDSALRTLLRYGLVQEIGRSSGPGRPILYETSPEFLQHFGLRSLGELPPLASGKELAEEDPESSDGER